MTSHSTSATQGGLHRARTADTRRRPPWNIDHQIIVSEDAQRGAEGILQSPAPFPGLPHGIPADRHVQILSPLYVACNLMLMGSGGAIVAVAV
jgi:hypothetical protein